MFKRSLAFTAALLAATPAMALHGHVIQVHHGYDCVEFILLEDANLYCGTGNVFSSDGGVYGQCAAIVPWYGIMTGQGTGQTELTVGQLPFFIAATSAIDTAFHETQAAFGAIDVQNGEGFSVTGTENTLLFGPGSAIGFDTSGPLTCKNIDVTGTTHTVTSIVNVNTPPGPYQ